MAKKYLTKVEVASSNFDRTGFYRGSQDGFVGTGHVPAITVTFKVIGNVTPQDIGRVVESCEQRLRDKFEEFQDVAD